MSEFAAKEILPERMLAEAENAKRILAASPYVTCDRLFSNSNAAAKILYTDFRAISFVSGSSSLATLRSLLVSGVKLFHVPTLHAKVYWIDGACFSLGSQNLTLQGKKNIEANVVSGTETNSDSISQFFNNLEPHAVALSSADLDLMEELTAELAIDFNRIASEAAEADKKVAQAMKLRKEREARQRRDKMTATLAELIKTLESSQTDNLSSVRATVRRLTNVSTDEWGNTSETHTNSLVPTTNIGFLGLIKDLRVPAKRLSRYLLINEDTGKLAFVRLAKTRITYFSSGLRTGSPFRFEEFSAIVAINFEWDLLKLAERSGSIELRSEESAKAESLATADFTFSLAGINIFNVELTISGVFARMGSAPLDQVLKGTEFKAYLVKHLTTPFTFKTALHGESALDFFAVSHPAELELRAHKFQGAPLLTARRVGVRI